MGRSAKTKGRSSSRGRSRERRVRRKQEPVEAESSSQETSGVCEDHDRLLSTSESGDELMSLAIVQFMSNCSSIFIHKFTK